MPFGVTTEQSRAKQSDRVRNRLCEGSVQQGEGACLDRERDASKCGGIAGREREKKKTTRSEASEGHQQDADHTRPKSMWERVTSHCCGCMGISGTGIRFGVNSLETRGSQSGQP
ncbi:hypothetical protein K377_05388 [Streptomyces sp. PsTaAH-137]|nr:hypothetical protein K377_05388 [Streptomyces sp. PsTaAH-137]